MKLYRFNSDSQSGSDHSNGLRGQLLVATPQLADDRFDRSVVLMIQHDQRGAFGVALNKPAAEEVKSAWYQLTGHRPNTAAENIFAGGPLNGPVLAIHRVPGIGDAEMAGGIQVSARLETVNQLLSRDDVDYRILIGLAGWNGGQLESELAAGRWYLLPLQAKLVFQNPDWMWPACLRECGRLQILALLGRDHIPDDPSLN